MENQPIENKGSYTEKQKQYIMTWRKKNREKFNEVCRKANAVYYQKNKEKKNQADRERYQKRKASQQLSLERQQIEHSAII